MVKFFDSMRRILSIFNEFNRKIWPQWIGRSSFSILGQAPRMIRNRCYCILLTLILQTALHAAEWTGKIGIEKRNFENAPLSPLQRRDSLSATFESEFYHDWQQGKQRIVVTPFARLDQSDRERSHVDLREFYWRGSYSKVDLYIGLRKLFWGVTESIHLIDIINQSDMVENIDGEDKLGQPMISLAYTTTRGDWEFFLMPYFRERTFPGTVGRLRTPLVVDPERTLYESAAGKNHRDYALRWSHIINDWDLGLSYFHGTNRTPQLMTVTDNHAVVLSPYYTQLDQLGLDLQYTHNAWLWKWESVLRLHNNRLNPKLKRSYAAVGGGEYTWYSIFSTDIGMILEYQYDNRSGLQAPVANNDIAIGTRFTFNDKDDSTLLAVLVIDVEQRSRFVSIEASRRLDNNLSVNIEMRIFSSATPQERLYSLRNDDYFEILLTKYF